MADHGQGADAFVVQGYIACARCGEWFVVGTHHTSIRLCSPCAIYYSNLSREHRLKYEVDGRVFLSPAPKVNHRSVKDLSPAAQQKNKEYLRLWNRAKSRAVTRLCSIYRPMWEVLMAEERAKVGLPHGFKSSRGPGPSEISKAILADLEEADERRERETSHRLNA